jgi:hypothetical protein
VERKSALCGVKLVESPTIGVAMSTFFPNAERVVEARQRLAGGHFGELDALMGASELAVPGETDLGSVIDEFCVLAAALGLSDACAEGFVVLVPVTVGGTTHTTPLFVDIELAELSFTSHPELGAGTVTDEVLVTNPRLIVDVRAELLGVLATWHNSSHPEA